MNMNTALINQGGTLTDLAINVRTEVTNTGASFTPPKR